MFERFSQDKIASGKFAWTRQKEQKNSSWQFSRFYGLIHCTEWLNLNHEKVNEPNNRNHVLFTCYIHLGVKCYEQMELQSGPLLVPSLLLLAVTERSWETITASSRRGWWEGEKEKEYFLLPITPRALLDRALLVNIYRRLIDIWGRVRSGVVDAELLALPGSGDSLIARKELCEAKIGEQMSLSPKIPLLRLVACNHFD